MANNHQYEQCDIQDILNRIKESEDNLKLVKKTLTKGLAITKLQYIKYMSSSTKYVTLLPIRST